MTTYKTYKKYKNYPDTGSGFVCLNGGEDDII